MAQVNVSYEGPGVEVYLSLVRTWDGARPQPVPGSYNERASPHIPTPHPQSLEEEEEEANRGKREEKVTVTRGSF